MALDVDDLEGMAPKLQAAGMKFLAPPSRNEFVITTYARDPFGNILELQQILPGSPLPGI
jgi:hypothetical protein